VSAVDAALWELNRLSPVIGRIHSSCQNDEKVKTANQDATLRHNSRSVAREASAAPAASFKRAYRQLAFWGFRANFREDDFAGTGAGNRGINSGSAPRRGR
jgi:hypothetical protein